MSGKVCRAIRGRRVLNFTYDKFPRQVEPHLHGWSQADKETLSAYQIGGGSRSGRTPFWRDFIISEMSGTTVTSTTFTGTRPGYNPRDKTMKRIHCRL